MKKGVSAGFARVASLVSLLIMTGAFLPTNAHASVIGDLMAVFKQKGTTTIPTSSSDMNVQTMPLARPAQNIDPAPARGGGDITVVDGSALMPDEGPAGAASDITKPKSSQISLYVVREGDTLGSIAKLFGVSTNTIRWANDIPAGGVIKVGQQLVILPVSGIPYTVKKGDTLASIAKKTGGDADEISSFNDVEDSTLAVGATIIVPDGEVSTPVQSAVATKTTPTTPKKTHATASSAEPAHDIGPIGTPEEDAYYMVPVSHYVETQGLHGYNAVDLAAPVGTPIMASASGDVIIARAGAWNGGYGNYVVIQHGNGSQTLYAHQSKIIVGVGEHVVQGQVIGYVGNTGRSTGPHLHFEVRNGPRNPFAR